GAQRARGQRLRARLIDFDQPPVAQRAFGRERIPFRLVEQCHGESEGRVRAQRAAARVSSSIAAQSSRISRSKRDRPKLRASSVIAGGGVTASASAISAAACATCSSVTASLAAGRSSGAAWASASCFPQKRHLDGGSCAGAATGGAAAGGG